MNEVGDTRRVLFGDYPYFSQWIAAYLPLSSRYAHAQYISGYPPPHRQEYQLMLENAPVADPSMPFAPEVPMIEEWRYVP